MPKGTRRKPPEKTAGGREDALQQLTAALSMVADDANVWMSILDREGRVVLWNRAAARISGYGEEEIVGRKIAWDLLYPDASYRETLKARTADIVERSASLDGFETTIRCRDESYRIVSWNERALTDAEGAAIGSLAFGFDVTERRQAEAEVQHRAELASLTHKVAHLVSSEMEDLAKLFPAIVESVSAVFSGYGVSLLLIDEDRGALVLESTAGRGTAATPAGYRVPMGMGLTGRAATTGETQVSGNVDAACHYIREAETNTRSELAVPMRSGSEVIGVLDLQSSALDAFDAVETAAIETLCIHIGAAISQARLLEEATGQAQRAAIINRIARAVGSTLDMGELMGIVYEGIVAALEAEAVCITRLDEEAQQLIVLLGIEGDVRDEGSRIPLGAGFSSHVVNTKRPLRIDDIQQQRDALPEPVAWGDTSRPYTSWLGVPMMIGDRVIGTIATMVGRVAAYGEKEEQLLATIADQVAVALENARLFEEQSGQAERLAVVNRVAKAVGSRLGLDDLLQTVYDEIAPMFENEALYITRVDEAAQEIEFLFGVEDGERLVPDRVPLGEGLTSHIVTTGRPLHIHHFEKEIHDVPVPRMWGNVKLHDSWLGVPMLVGDRTVGTIATMIDRPHAYSDEQEQLLCTIADQVAVALENARLFGEMQRRADQMTLVNDIGGSISALLDLDDLLDRAVHLIQELFGFDHVAYLAADPDGESLVMRVRVGSLAGLLPLGYRIPLGKGLVGQAGAEKKTLCVSDVQSDSRYVNPVGTEVHTRAELDVPVCVGDRLLGVLDIQSAAAHAFDKNDVMVMETLADQLAVAIENARLYEDAQRELSERQRAESALGEERTLLRTIIDNVPDFIYAKDLESRFTVANRAIAGLVGAASPEDLLGKTDADYHPADMAAGYRADEERVLESGEPILGREEPVVIQVTGEKGWLLTSKMPLLDPQGQVVGIVGIGRDISERKRNDEKLQRYVAEIEEANEEIKQFAYIVSHDLRAPLVNLKGFASELRGSMDAMAPAVEAALAQLPEEGRSEIEAAVREDIPESLGFIESSVARMDGFINAVLKLSRIGRRELRFEEVDPNEVVAGAVAALAHQIEEEGVEVEIDALPTLTADRTSVEQIFGNLLTNAVNYLVPSRPGRIQVGGRQDEHGWTFWVRDNGRGISHEDADKVFAPFRRAGRQNVPGEGMGLSYVRTIVRQHKGRIWFDSEDGSGTTFYFAVPASLGQDKEP